MGSHTTPPKYRGVSWHVSDHKYRVKLKKHGRHVFLGNYDDPKVAAKVYDACARLLHGPDAIFNFLGGLAPPEVPEPLIRAMLVEKGLL